MIKIFFSLSCKNTKHNTFEWISMEGGGLDSTARRLFPKTDIFFSNISLTIVFRLKFNRITFIRIYYLYFRKTLDKIRRVLTATKVQNHGVSRPFAVIHNQPIKSFSGCWSS